LTWAGEVGSPGEVNITHRRDGSRQGQGDRVKGKATESLNIRKKQGKLAQVLSSTPQLMFETSPYSSRYRKPTMITAFQMRAARTLLGFDQRKLAEAAGVSLATVQRMESSEGQVRGNVESLVKVVEALDKAGVELIYEGAVSRAGGRGVRLKEGSAAKNEAST